ncbi:MAG: D-alanyl-D-alanine carboxypeptidase/D-alanyl-D-alanine-endopeptidase [Paludibacteraceae bacterium]|nr:D-alanyl-D-alanine carboxypeptidase/D-alanyl-D-alanine-endopeptidase [Paludibacteraceae bacterium]
MKKLLLFLSLLPLLASGQSESISIFLDDPHTRYANIGVYIRDLRSGEEIEAYRKSNAIPPASVMKILTTATALEIMGEDSCLVTVLEYSGKIDNGTLNGNLYIHGYGDPVLGSAKQGQTFLQTWAKAVRDTGIKTINGDIVADVSYFNGDALNPAWLWEDAGNYYAPGIYSLAYMDNTMNVILRSNETGTIAKVLYTVPEVPEIEFENHIRCTSIQEDGAYIHGMPYNFKRYLVGAIPSNRGQFGVRGDLPNPGLLLAQHFTSRLRQAGITINGKATYISEPNLMPRTQLYTHRSTPLGEIVVQTNQHSINLYAEMLYRLLGARLGTPCTLYNSEKMVRNYWRNRGVNLMGATIKDGCGLAPQNAISPESLVDILTYMSASSNRDAFYESLPVSGRTGTLRSLLAGTELEGRVHAKSGTIAGTKNYAGYIELPDGRRWVFAVMISSAIGKSTEIKNVIEKYLIDVYRRNR